MGDRDRWRPDPGDRDDDRDDFSKNDVGDHRETDRAPPPPPPDDE